MTKIITLLIFVFLISITAHSQRYVPLMEEGRTLTESIQGPVGKVHDFATYNGKLLFVGEFVDVNGQDIQSIGYWDGESYSPFEEPLAENYLIRDVLVTPLGLVISGDFQEQGNILLFTGNEWTELGEGFNDRVRDIVWLNGRLYACGDFSSSGGTSLSHIAVWENGWNPLGDGLNERAKEMIVYEEELYIVGDFEFSGGISVSHIGKWDGTEWSEVAGGFNDNANCLAVFESQLVVGGSFTSDSEGLSTYDQLVVYDGVGFENLYSGGVELEQVGYLSSDAESLYVSQGRNRYEAEIPGDGLVYSGGEMKDLLLNFGAGELINYQGEIYCNSLNSTTVGVDADFYQNSAMGRLLKNGLLKETFEGNNIRTDVGCKGTLFSEIQLSMASGYYTNPLESGVSSIYSAAPWMGGIMEDDELKLSYNRYENFSVGSEDHRYVMGPISESYDNEYVEKYFRVWRVNQEEINYHIAHYSETDYEMPEVIRNWPGNGRVEHGESSHMASFVDVNENGWYEPLAGDYPYIKGDFGIFYLISGSRGESLNAGGTTDCEVGVLLYGYIDESEELDNTLFIRYQIINKSAYSFSDFKFGFWADIDVGGSSDDFVGCSPSQNTFYIFNGDSYDENTSYSVGYGENIPTQGVKFLNRTMGSHMYYTTGFSNHGDPQELPDFWNYMNHRWRDGSALTLGPLGYDNFGEEVSYMYPSQSGDVTDYGDGNWTEIMAGNSLGDRRSVGSTEGTLFGSGERMCVDLALITSFTEETEMTNLESLLELYTDVDEIQQFYDSNSDLCGAETFPLSVSDHSFEDQFVLYPNPATDKIYLSGLNHRNVSVQLIDLSGRTIKSEKLVSEYLPVSDVSTGMYILNIIENEVLLAQKKIIIR